MSSRTRIPLSFFLLSVVVGCGGAPGPGASDPSGGTPAGTPTTLGVGDPCFGDGLCPAGGSGTPACLAPPEFPGGYCAVEDCSSHGHDCPSQSQCVIAPTNRCLKQCATDTDCRPGYTCQGKLDAAAHGTILVCLPP